jgi:hypothetical protein
MPVTYCSSIAKVVSSSSRKREGVSSRMEVYISLCSRLNRQQRGYAGCRSTCHQEHNRLCQGARDNCRIKESKVECCSGIRLIALSIRVCELRAGKPLGLIPNTTISLNAVAVISPLLEMSKSQHDASLSNSQHSNLLCFLDLVRSLTLNSLG